MPSPIPPRQHSLAKTALHRGHGLKPQQNAALAGEARRREVGLDGAQRALALFELSPQCRFARLHVLVLGRRCRRQRLQFR